MQFPLDEVSVKRDDNSAQINPEPSDGGMSSHAEARSSTQSEETNGSVSDGAGSSLLDDAGVADEVSRDGNTTTGVDVQTDGNGNPSLTPPDLSLAKSSPAFKKKKMTEQQLRQAFDDISLALDAFNSRQSFQVSELSSLAERMSEEASKIKKKSSGLDGGDSEKEIEGEVRSKKVTRDAKYLSQLIDAHREKGLEGALKKDILEILGENPEVAGYDVVFLYDHDQITRYHANIIYQRLSAITTKKDIFLILRSPGGEVEPAYLISKMCNRFKLSKFVVGIPADAKSAATLLSLGADELHMGAMSELGPIDPQINGFPALAFSGALERITKLASLHPGAAEMLSKYLIGSSLDLRALGHYERITESATQYAMRLLKSKVESTEDDHERVSVLAGHFTNHYKDHNFVIDMDEACELLSDNVVKANTALYHTCHEVHRYIDLFHQVAAVKNLGQKLIVLGDNFVLSA